ncbi:hypothetical protein M3Y98_00009200 [Aphelenchoides besseyi]|nr:hypothetical protein M3Y98_00009200 [Aphelenchoides besseyi]
MIKVLPLLLLTHNLNKSTCIGPCFGMGCPQAMTCINGECCDVEEPFFPNSTAPDPPDKPMKLLKKTKNRGKQKPLEALPTATTLPPKSLELKPLPEKLKTVKVGRLITPVPSIPQPEFPSPIQTTVVTQPMSRQVDGSCVDQSYSCGSMRHLCVNVIYKVMLSRICMLTCGTCKNTKTTSNNWSVRRPEKCTDIGRNCKSVAQFCDHAAYRPLLQHTCQRTCSACS